MIRFETLAIGLVRGWVRLYTGRLECEVRDGRRAEIESDLWEHRREASAAGLRPTQSGLEIVARSILGVLADLAWRRAVPRAAVAHDQGGAQMSGNVKSSWWLVPATVLAGLHIFAAVANWSPGWLPPAPTTDPLAVVVLGLGVAALVGVALRNRAPKLAGALVIAGVWLPLIAPFYGPREYGGFFGAFLAVLVVVGAIQNMTRRPITAEPRPA